MEALLTVPGAARKTANVVLGTAFGIASGVVVDTHVQRISQRLDLTKETEPVKIERDLMKIIPQGEVDPVFASDHSSRPRVVRGAESEVRRMQARTRCATRRTRPSDPFGWWAWPPDLALVLAAGREDLRAG